MPLALGLIEKVLKGFSSDVQHLKSKLVEEVLDLFCIISKMRISSNY